MALTEAEPKGQHQIMLRVKDVSKAFIHNSNEKNDDGALKNHRVLNGVSIDIKEGEFVTIVGPSGCGKSTLLNIIAGLDSADSGSVSIKGDLKTSTDPNRIVIFQEAALFPWLTVLENVEFGLRIAGVPKEERKRIANHFINTVHLTNFANSYVYQLSGGMKQRAAIARALALNPKILLMDEPFAALDVQTREILYSQLLQIHKDTKKTILFVTHNINEAILLGNRIIVLSSVLGNIKREFTMDIPRPRDIDSPEMSNVKRQVLKELEEDFRFDRRQ